MFELAAHRGKNLAPTEENFASLVEKLQAKLLVEITAVVTEIEDGHPIYNEQLRDRCDLYEGVFGDGLACMVFELISGYRLVLFDAPSCCAVHYFEFPKDDIEHVVGSQFLALFADPNSEVSVEDEDQHSTKDSMTLGLFTNRLIVRFPVYNEHNGYYGGLKPVLAIVDDQGNYVGHGDVPAFNFEQLAAALPTIPPAIGL